MPSAGFQFARVLTLTRGVQPLLEPRSSQLVPAPPRGGAGTSWDERGSNNGWTPRVNVSTRANWKPAEGITLQGSASFEPAFRDFSDYLTVLELNVNIALAMMDNLSMYFTLRDEYNSNPGCCCTRREA